MNEFIDSLINTSHQWILQGGYEEAVNALKSLKYRIHDESVKVKINEFESSHDIKLKSRLEEIEKSDLLMTKKNEKAGETWAKYSMSYLSFYDGLRKQDGVF